VAAVEWFDRVSERVSGRGGRPRIGAVIAVAVAVAFLVWLLFIRGDDGEETVTGQAEQARVSEIGPIEATRSDLLELQEEAGHPVYWLGEMEGKEIEVTRTTDANIYVRYLDTGASVGEKAPFLTVSTYPFADAFRALEVVAERPGSVSERLDDGALVVRADEAATSVYIAWPGQDVQVEIFDADPDEASSAATSGDLTPVE
jgi:hypothetical protein